jgi:hypothetical protein
MWHYWGYGSSHGGDKYGATAAKCQQEKSLLAIDLRMSKNALEAYFAHSKLARFQT